MPDDVELDAAALIAVLLDHAVQFVVIGGLAAAIHGSPFATQDLDITPARGTANLGRLSDALRELGARVWTQGVDEGLPFDHDADSLGAVGVWNLTTPHGRIDISFVPNGTTGFDDLVREAADVNAFGLAIPVASLADIIRSKQAANRPKDQRVLPVLREILASRYKRE